MTQKQIPDNKTIQNIICFTIGDFDDMWTLFHQVAYRLSKHHRLLWVETIYNCGMIFKYPKYFLLKLKNVLTSGLKKHHDNLFIYSPPPYPFPLIPVKGRYFIILSRILNKINFIFMSFLLKRCLRKCGMKNPIIWSFQPKVVDLIGRLGEKLVVYDIGDDIPAMYKEVSRRNAIVEMENELIRKSDIVFVSSSTLFELKKKYTSNIHLIGPGVDFELYNKVFTHKLTTPEDIKDIKKPIIGYFGVLDGRLDFELLEYMARGKPLWSIVLIGPVDAKEWSAPLNNYNNVHFLGPKHRDELPSYLQVFDVCIVPYRVIEFTKSIYPSKTCEYLATGKPVVCSYLPSVKELAEKNIIKMSQFKEESNEENYKEFIALVENSLNEKDDAAIKRRIEYARESSWDSKVELKLKLIEQLGKL